MLGDKEVPAGLLGTSIGIICRTLFSFKLKVTLRSISIESHLRGKSDWEEELTCTSSHADGCQMAGAPASGISQATRV